MPLTLPHGCYAPTGAINDGCTDSDDGIAHGERIASANGRAQRIRRRGDASVGRSEFVRSGWDAAEAAVKNKVEIGRRKCIAPANGCASTIVNVSPLPTDGANESSGGTMYPMDVANKA